MNSQKLSGAVSCLAAILILAADKIFAPVCKGTMELANGGECMMRCHYYGIALFLFGLLLLAESVLLFFGTHDFKLPVVIIIWQSSVPESVSLYINHRCHRRIRIHATTFQTEYLITFPVIYNQESKLSMYAKKPESDR